jgi:small subunit ribosomal protein S16
MINIRLQRRGRKNDPSFRVIVVDSKKKPKTGNYLEMVGSYDPRTDRVELKGERIKEWMQQGAQVSGTVHNLLISQKIIEGKKINVLPKKTAPKPAASEAQPKETPAPAAPAAAETATESAAPTEADTAAEAAPTE